MSKLEELKKWKATVIQMYENHAFQHKKLSELMHKDMIILTSIEEAIKREKEHGGSKD